MDGEELVIYTDMEDLVEKAAYYLEHDEEREWIVTLHSCRLNLVPAASFTLQLTKTEAINLFLLLDIIVNVFWNCEDLYN